MILNLMLHNSSTAHEHSYVVGRGFKISLPVSSQDILKSLSTSRVRDVSICGAITNLCMPKINNVTVKIRKMGK